MANNYLLLLHGTIYGDIAQVLPVVQFTGRSSNFDAQVDQDEWREDLFGAYLPEAAISGTMTYNEPIDFIHWTMDGHIGETGMEWWQQCMTLLMRHI